MGPKYEVLSLHSLIEDLYGLPRAGMGPMVSQDYGRTINANPIANSERAKLWHDCAERINLDALPFRMRLFISPHGPDFVAAAMLRAIVMDRDSLGERELTFSITVPEWPGERSARRWLRGFVLKFLAHELDEALLVDGVRVFDPHRPDLALPIPETPL